MQSLRLNVDMERLTKLATPAAAKIRQLHKLVQDIKKNDGSLLDKIRRLKNKPRPNVPARDYRDDNREVDQFSEQEYDNDSGTYDDPDGDGYEPPPSERVSKTPSASLPMGDYIDNCRDRPSQPPRRPLRPTKASKELPPEPHSDDEEDYENPDATTDDDNYVKPEETTIPNCTLQDGFIFVSEHSLSHDSFEIPNREDRRFSASRSLPVPSKQSLPLPPKPSPRINVRSSPLPFQDSENYEVCDDFCEKPAGGRPPLLPKPPLKEKPPKPTINQKPELKTRDFESRTLPALPTEEKPRAKALTMDFKRPKMPVPHFNLPKPAERENTSAEKASLDKDEDAYLHTKPWYASRCDRKTADDALLRSNKDGAFMVRQSSGHDPLQPYTLVVLYNSRVYNIPIRHVPSAQQYALGREKKGEEYFSSLSKIIENHQKYPLVLIDCQSNSKDTTMLCHPVKP